MNAASWLEGLPASERWRALLRTEAPRLATWVLALALGVQAAFIVTDLAGAGRAPRSAVAPPQPLQQRFTDVAAITDAHLFGAAPVAKPSDTNAPETSMPLVLTGIIAGNDPQNGLAILGPTAQTAKVHAVGDTVPGGARLHSVYTDRVIIDRNGQLESLVLPRQAGNAAPAPSAAALPTQSPVVERMRRTLTEQPGLIADLLRPQAVMDGDKVKGFRVYPGRNRVAFARLGLRPGDEVIAINGTPLDDQDRGQAILNTLGTSPEARVTVIRNNQQQDLTLNIAQVAQEAEIGLQAGGAGAGPGMPNASQFFAPGAAPGQPNVPAAAPAAVPPQASAPAPEPATPPAANPGASATGPTNTPSPAPAPEPPNTPEGTPPP
ncbi:MAG TPA: type II secretion system protein GspC [Steroidobacteraceae bacterium]|nr:type II secretion system protein GspC [Steroidobacteraceae bacterium]